MLILVTGASKGIGFEMVKQLSNSGHLVIAVSRNIDTVTTWVNKSNSHLVLPLKADITKEAHRKLISKAIKNLQIPLDVLVNNAGAIVNKPFEKTSIEDISGVYNTNVFGPYALIQVLLPTLNKNGSHILNIGSMGGFQGSSKFAGLSAYSSSKAALSGLTECLAVELNSKKISVNCLALGAVQTEMLAKAFPGYKAPLKANDMAAFICEFALNGHRYFNGKIIPVSSTTP